MTKRLVAGVDSSTQSTKVALHDIETGQLVASASAPHPATTPPVSEQDPASWSQAMATALGQLEPHLANIEAISIAGQQHGLVVLDEHGAALRPAKLWNDTTAADHATRLVGDDPSFWADRCGSMPVAAFTISKLAWLIDQEPEAASRVRYIMLPHDYLTWSLTGEHVTDRGDASGTGWFDPSSNEYRSELLGRVVDDPASWLEFLPRVVGPSDVAGTVTAEAAASLGLTPGIPVASGTGDNMAAALGLGMRPGDAAISLGTSGTVYATSPTPTTDASGAIAGFADGTGNFLPLLCTMNATHVTNAVAGWLNVSLDELAALALNADPTGSDRPVLAPYLDGERNPNLPTASGTWFGLRTTSTREQLAQSAFDSVLCSLLEGFDALAANGIPLDGEVNLIGGGAKSGAYQQRAADLLGRTVRVPTVEELVATGAAVQAAAVLAGTPIGEVQERWRDDRALFVEPAASDGPEVRELHRQARAHAHILAESSR